MTPQYSTHSGQGPRVGPTKTTPGRMSLPVHGCSPLSPRTTAPHMSCPSILSMGQPPPKVSHSAILVSALAELPPEKKTPPPTGGGVQVANARRVPRVRDVPPPFCLPRGIQTSPLGHLGTPQNGQNTLSALCVEVPHFTTNQILTVQAIRRLRVRHSRHGPHFMRTPIVAATDFFSLRLLSRTASGVQWPPPRGSARIWRTGPKATHSRPRLHL